jgi:lipoate---protein ligase
MLFRIKKHSTNQPAASNSLSIDHEMTCLDLSLTDPTHNLACDEVLLNEVNEGRREPVLRFWQSPQYFVVLGYSNSIERECDTVGCSRFNIPIHRRISGGGTILQGPGCLNYSLVLPIDSCKPTCNLGQTNNLVLTTHQQSISKATGRTVTLQGQSDLAIDNIKFSGNAQRRLSKALLFHGTFLLSFDISMFNHVLRFPSSTPAYRGMRSHDAFCKNLSLTVEKLKTALIQSWKSFRKSEPIDIDAVNDLANLKYSTMAWLNRCT